MTSENLRIVQNKRGGGGGYGPSDAAIQTAEYAAELLNELESLAEHSKLPRLAALPGAAGDEARKIAAGR